MYTLTVEKLHEIYPEVEPLARMHYAQMCERLEQIGIAMSPFNPRLDQYFKSSQEGWLLTYTARIGGELVGYANVYLTSDMHNNDLIAKEDTLYVTPEHRNGVGKQIVKFALSDLARRGVKRVSVDARTDLRVAKMWQRMGFKPASQSMIYVF